MLFMTDLLLPAIWLITLIAGFPLFSETVYTPALPEIAHSLNTSESLVEHTLTIYLLGFALGTLFWGKLSDRFGRKPCLLMGFFIYILGCMGCYGSSSIEMLMLSRFLQAFGGSVGSVLSQAITRDSFHGPALGKVFAMVGSALAIFPAIGPVIGGVIAENFGWANIFLCLIIVAVILCVIITFQLQESHPHHKRNAVTMAYVIKRFMVDKRVIGCGLIVGVCNGLGFSYFSESPFVLMSMLGLSPSFYGLSFVLTAMAAMGGGLFSKKLLNTQPGFFIMRAGILIMILSTGIFTGVTLIHTYSPVFSPRAMIGLIIGLHMVTMFGFCMVMSVALSLALVEYKNCIGTASSIFGFLYYGIVCLVNFGMGCFHNGTLLPMPLYFFFLTMFMGVCVLFLKHALITKVKKINPLHFVK